MKLKKLVLKDFCGIPDLALELGDFTCLVGGNGAGKTTVLNAISLLCSNLLFSEKMDVPEDQRQEWTPTASAQTRLESYLSRNVRIGTKGFLVEGTFEHEGQDIPVCLTEKGFDGKCMAEYDWWHYGICYFAKFDIELTKFQLKKSLWEKFAKHYEGITGIPVSAEFYVETDLIGSGFEAEMAIDFVMDKGRRGKVPCRLGSAGEKKLARTLSHVVNLDRSPSLALVDNLEMHVHHSRHLRMFEEIKSLFSGIQIIATTHSTVIIDKYEPRSEIVDLDSIFGDF